MFFIIIFARLGMSLYVDKGAFARACSCMFFLARF